MHRRALLITLGGGLVATQRAVAQPAAKVPRVGVISFGSAGAQRSPVQQAAFEASLRALGWVPGSTIVIEYRWAEGDPDRLARQVAELVRSAPDVIVARTPQAQHAIVAATTTIPIVVTGSADPVALGFVKSLPRPGGNATALSFQLYELFAKQLEILKQAVPKLRRVGVLGNPSITGSAGYAAATQAIDGAARLLRLEIQYATIANAAELPEAFSAMSRARAGAVMVIPHGGTPLSNEVKQLVALPAKYRLPTIVHVGVLRRGGRPHGLRRRSHRHPPAIGPLRGQDPQGNQARGHPRGAAERASSSSSSISRPRAPWASPSPSHCSSAPTG